MDKDVLIFLHGWAKKKEDYQELADLLAKKYIVYALDLPGFGVTAIDRSYDLDDYVKHVHKFTQKKSLKKFVLAGHSFGGRVAIKFALKYSGLLEKLILVDSAGIERKSLETKVAKWLAALTPMRLRELFRPMIGSRDYLQSVGLMRETMKKIVAENLEPELSKIKTPTLLIWGEDDHTTPLWMGKTMAAQIQGSTLKVISGGDHGIPYRKAKEVVNAIINN